MPDIGGTRQGVGGTRQGVWGTGIVMFRNISVKKIQKLRHRTDTKETCSNQ